MQSGVGVHGVQLYVVGQGGIGGVEGAAKGVDFKLAAQHTVYAHIGVDGIDFEPFDGGAARHLDIEALAQVIQAGGGVLAPLAELDVQAAVLVDIVVHAEAVGQRGVGLFADTHVAMVGIGHIDGTVEPVNLHRLHGLRDGGIAGVVALGVVVGEVDGVAAVEADVAGRHQGGDCKGEDYSVCFHISLKFKV